MSLGVPEAPLSLKKLAKLGSPDLRPGRGPRAGSRPTEDIRGPPALTGPLPRPGEGGQAGESLARGKPPGGVLGAKPPQGHPLTLCLPKEGAACSDKGAGGPLLSYLSKLPGPSCLLHLVWPGLSPYTSGP